MLGTDRYCDEGGNIRAAIVPTVSCAVLNDNVPRSQDYFAGVQFESNCSGEDDVEIERRRRMHPRPTCVGERLHVLHHESVERLALTSR
jgi:hypothetical protein